MSEMIVSFFAALIVYGPLIASLAFLKPGLIMASLAWIIMFFIWFRYLERKEKGTDNV